MIHQRNEIWNSMQSDCAQCSGLCCTALFFSKMDGFPENKTAGKPCVNLLGDFRCKIHSQLENQKMKGCIGYDCFGAGQQVTQTIYKGQTWRTLPEQSQEIFDVFCTVFRMRQMNYFLTQAMILKGGKPVKDDILLLLEENRYICQSYPEIILSFDIEGYQQRVNIILKQVCSLYRGKKQSIQDFVGKSFKGKDMRGLDFSGRLLIGADFSNCILKGAIFLGADTRDADFSNTDMRDAVFLTQGQINWAKGNRNTKIPDHLIYPVTWKESL